ncbi:diguanylate cyclase [Zestomonas thermotolerans]|uniref:diguanylate cyclase n=1 Tax=Zestomonas thermotolerans TaxID=157784 RepID=UPI0004820A40|nr:diguanylate cyclase [Pseudomonas thermotolerans]
MTPTPTEQQSAEWLDCLAQFPADSVQCLAQLAEMRQAELAEHFYTQMLADPEASQYLSHERVRDHLSSSLQRWVVQLFGARSAEQIAAQVDLQRQVGEVHARIGVPVSLVLRGARCLKRRLHELIDALELPLAGKMAAMRLGSKLIDLAMEIMSQAYSSSHERNARAEEAYRLFSVVQNIGAERERQRAALLDWENTLIYELALGRSQAAQTSRLASSEFGLWFSHKGAYAFKDTPESQRILACMQNIDDELLVRLAAAGSEAERMQVLSELREQTRSLVFLLDSLFEQVNELESGRDVLTRMLNRKYLPVVMGKELAHAREHGQSFALLAIDIDHFKRINDQHGHEAGDMILQQLAALLSNHSRGGDYLFRLGGEEFLLLAVSVDRRAAQQMAENLRSKVERESFRLPGNQPFRLTVSVGVAVYDGHPDYQKLLRGADGALYIAKNGGRNRVVMAGEQP